jgi:hypothetical protein
MGIQEKIRQLGSAYLRRIEDLNSFYNREESNSNPRTIAGILTRNRFLLYTRILNCLWMPAYYGSAIVSCFDHGKYNKEKIISIIATSPAFLAGMILFGAFWSKLGNEKLLLDALKRKPVETLKNILMNNLVGNLYNEYYSLRTAQEIVARSVMRFEDAAAFCLDT